MKRTTLISHPRIFKRVRWAAAPIAFASAFFLFGGCSKEQKEKDPVVTVQVTPAKRATISQSVSAEAVIYPLEQATIAPKITAPITEFKVRRGDRVRKGQLLAILENKDLAGQAEASRGSFEQADAGYKTSVDATIPQQLQKAQLDADAAKTAFDAQQRVYDSRKELFQQGALPQRDLDSATVALAQARGANEVAQKQLADLQRLGKEQAIKSAHGSRLTAEGQMRTAEAQLSYSEIRSPIDGVVTDRPLYAGDLATANQPILTVMNLSRLIAKCHIAQSDAAVLKVGNPAELSVAGLDEAIKGRVTLVSPALDPGSTTIEVWVEAVKPNEALKPGMTVEISMTAKTVKDALVVPTPAVFRNNEGANYVVIAGSDGHAHVKTIQVGVHNSEFSQIASGVNLGDPIVSSGGYALPDNTQIKIEAPGADEKEAGAKEDKDEKSAKDDKTDKAAASKPAKKGKE
ncbi:MAG TPA: efflux RND transporter periplasmic adaptor subunit [Candidatus Acidoferrum sp.]|nr:efflux RND transporter periplasmic adaptor subunit [Candidatus Acidoferrum sp.]